MRRTKTYVYLNKEGQRWEIFHRRGKEAWTHRNIVNELRHCPACGDNPKEEKRGE